MRPCAFGELQGECRLQVDDSDSNGVALGAGSSVLRVGQVPNPDVRRVFDYWRRHCDEGLLMPRQAFDPVHLGGLLANVLFVERRRTPADLIIRVAGQEIEERYGRSMRGMSIYDTFPIVRRKDTSHQWAELLRDAQPKYRRGPMVFPNERAFDAERLLLPLSDAGQGPPDQVAYILGVILYAPLSEAKPDLTAVSATLIA